MLVVDARRGPARPGRARRRATAGSTPASAALDRAPGRAPRRPRPPPCATARGWRPRRPASATGTQVADPLEAGEVGDAAARRPTACRRGRSRARRRPARAPARCGRARPCRPRRGRGGAGRRRSGRSSSSGELGREVLGVQVVGDDLGHDAVQVAAGGRRPAGTSGTWRGARGRRCGGWARRRRPWPRDGALQLGADGQHRRGGRRTAAAAARARSPGTGAAPAAGRRSARTTESSQRMWIGRSWVSSPSTSGPSRRDRVVVVVGDRLVAEVAARHHERPADAGQQQVVERAVGQEQPELGQARAPRRRRPSARRRRRGASTIGRRGERQRGARPRRRGRTAARPPPGRPPSPRTACRRAPCAGAARPTARGVGGVDGEVVAADALHRDDRPAPQGVDGRGQRGRTLGHDRARRGRARPAAGRTPGRRWAGRGSGGRPGRRTRPGTPAHIVKPAIVVAGRSYGTLSTIV